MVTGVTIVLPHAAPGKPRQTQRDKWARRPCVLAYRAWADLVRSKAGRVPSPTRTAQIFIEATYAMPSGWSRKRRTRMLGQKKRTAPDPDNVAKGILDALWSPDAAVGDVTIRRRWGLADVTVIRILLEPMDVAECDRR
jgi:Holliday junction resolvase RusA-like endonuclease